MSDENSTAPLTPDEARAEFQRVVSDPQHPQHTAWHKGWTTAKDYVDSIYKRVPDADAKVEIGGNVVGAAPVTSDAAAQEKDDAAFRVSVATATAERGIDDALARAEGAKLFAGKEGEALLDLLDERTWPGLAPEAEVQAHVQLKSYLAELGRLRREAPQGAGDEVTPEAFQASLDAALKERGIDRRSLAEIGAQLFAEHPDEYRRVAAYLDSHPARLAAYVRTAEALMMLRRLYQSVS